MNTKSKKLLTVSSPIAEIEKTMQRLAANNPFTEIEKIMQRVAANNPFSEIEKSLQKVAANNPFSEIEKSLQKVAANNPIAEIEKTIQKFLAINPFAEIEKTLQTLTTNNQLTNLQKILETLATSNPIIDYKQVNLMHHQSADVLINNLYAHNFVANAFEQTYKENISSHSNETDVVGFNPSEATFKVIEIIASQAIEFGVTRLSIEFYLSLFVTILFFYISMSSSSVSEQNIIKSNNKAASMSEVRIVDLINKSHDILLDRLEKIENQKSKEIFLVVDRTVKLRVKPSTKSTVKKILYVNQKVRLVEKKGKWIKIEYFNNHILSNESGWCYKKYFQIEP